MEVNLTSTKHQILNTVFDFGGIIKYHDKKKPADSTESQLSNVCPLNHQSYVYLYNIILGMIDHNTIVGWLTGWRSKRTTFQEFIC